MDVSVRELKARLSEYLRRVRAGEVLHVTLRGRRIVRLMPEAAAVDPEDEALRRLDAQPWITPPRTPGKLTGMAQPARIKPGEKTLADIVSEDRG